MRILADPSFLDDIETTRERWAVSGLTVSHVDLNAGIREAKGFGKPSSGPVSEDSIIPICSNTKFMTAIAMGILVEEGKVSWSSVVADVLPEFKLQSSEATATITVEDMLSHQSGFDSFIEVEGDPVSHLVRSIEIINSLSLHLPQHQQYQYADLPFSIMGHLISKFSGMPYTTFVQEKIFKPLGMKQTSFGRPVPGGRVVTPAVSLASEGLAREITQPFADLPMDNVTSPGGGALSSPADVAKWLECLIQMYHGTSTATVGSVISSGTLKELLRPRVQSDDQFTIRCKVSSTSFPEMTPPWYALAQATMQYRGKVIYWHHGAGPGTGSLLAWLPEKKLGIAVWANTTCGGWECGLPVILQYLDKYFAFETVDWVRRIEDLPDCKNEEPVCPPVVDKMTSNVDDLPEYAAQKLAMIKHARTFGPTFSGRSPDLILVMQNRPLFCSYIPLWHVSAESFWGHRHVLYQTESGPVDIAESVLTCDGGDSPAFAWTSDQDGRLALHWFREWSEGLLSPTNPAQPRAVLLKAE